jgi:shikimate kinase
MGQIALQDEFNRWLDDALLQPIPASVIAFNFNLYKPWAIEVIGSDTYDENDPDWASDESFRPEAEQLLLPAPDSTRREDVLEQAKSLVLAYLDRRSVGSEHLRRAKAVAVGFTDGDLHRVWPR